MINKLKRRTHGFRFSGTDGAIIIVAIISSILLANHALDIAMLVLFVTFHFFLFCNVFRISRKPELIWAGTFILSSLLLTSVVSYTLFLPMLIQLPLTAFLIHREVRQPYYHGIFSESWNKEHLSSYLEG